MPCSSKKLQMSCSKLRPCDCKPRPKRHKKKIKKVCKRITPIGDDVLPIDCIACMQRHPKIIKCTDLNEYKKAFTCEQICKSLSAHIEFKPMIHPEKLTYVVDPPLEYLDPFQKVGYPAAPPNPISIENKNVLVLNAGNDKGQAIAEMFKAKGCNVIGTSRNSRCKSKHLPYAIMPLDTRVTRNVRRFFAKLFRCHFTNKKIDILILNGEMAWVGQVADEAGDALSAMSNDIISGYQRCIFHALKHMRHSDDTRIIALASASASIQAVSYDGGHSIFSAGLTSLLNLHQLESLCRKAQGVVLHEPTFTVLEQTAHLSAFGFNEMYHSTCVNPNTDPYCQAARLFAAYYTQVHGTDVIGLTDAICRIAQSPRPGIVYHAQLVNALPPPFSPSTTWSQNYSNTLNQDDSINLINTWVYPVQFSIPNLELFQTQITDAYCHCAEA
jgi:NAD(P)-dependent dehydrogenase (short-subunit alcohol dehydrogenase family)